MRGVYAGDDSISFFFFFSSRRRHTRYWRDWSSDVCSSDLDARAYGRDDREIRRGPGAPLDRKPERRVHRVIHPCQGEWTGAHLPVPSEERQEQESCNSRTGMPRRSDRRSSSTAHVLLTSQPPDLGTTCGRNQRRLCAAARSTGAEPP